MDNKKNKKNNSEVFRIFALGGLGEVGKNMYVIECEDEIAVVDSGILFPDSSYGINYLFSDISYLKENEEKIVGVFITHGHEDHIGGLPFLLQGLKKTTIYASGLAVGLINNKFQEFANLEINLKEYNADSVYHFKHFDVSFFATTHSIPDSYGIAFKTKYGYIIHTGDFKFDLTPIGRPTDYKKIADMGKEGIVLLLSDSTNAQVNSLSPSEKEIGKNIRTLFKQINGRIIISTFASNVYRVDQIVQACIEDGRKMIVFGRSMEKNIKVARKMGYINAPSDTFITAKEFPFFPPEKLVIACTGSQGEPLAALSRIANGTHKQIKIAPGDTIIFSSSIIPGNQESINNIVNELYKGGASVIVNSPILDTHTSGHASTSELKLMLVLTKPKYFMPIHGEYAMLKCHANIAIDAGVQKENCFVLDNGEVLELSSKGIRKGPPVQAGDVFIDNNDQIVNGSIIRERKMLSDDGVLSIIFTLNKNNEVSYPMVVSHGFIYSCDANEIASNIKRRAYDKMVQYLSNAKEVNINYIKGAINNDIITYVQELTDRKPMVITSILNV